MRDWIVILVLYVLSLGLFRILGGLRGTAETFRRWGHASSGIRMSPGSSS
jgi:hypothetical protein